MSIFNPEFKEGRESGLEKNRFSPNFKERLLRELRDGKEAFPDIIQCPVKSCSNPIELERHKNLVTLRCSSCDWTNTFQINNPSGQTN